MATGSTPPEGAADGTSTPPPSPCRWEVDVSRTFDAAPEVVWDVLVSERGLAIWLGDEARLDPADDRWSSRDDDGEVERFVPGERVRLRLPTDDGTHETCARLVVAAVDGGRARLELHEEELRDPGERMRRRHHWRGVADRLEAVLRER